MFLKKVFLLDYFVFLIVKTELVIIIGTTTKSENMLHSPTRFKSEEE